MGEITAVVLGVMQDGGLPHAGCLCRRCQAAFAGDGVDYAACLALVDGRHSPAGVWLIDATPDIKYQLQLLAGALGEHPSRPGRLRPPDGLLLTHGHMGHTAGLVHLGPEAMAVRDLPVYAPAGLVQVLQDTALWRPLVQLLDLRPLAALQPLALAPGLTVTPIPVPHRDEWQAGTVAFRVQGPRRSLLYLPDIDAWAQWPAARDTLAGVDVALVDGSFYSLAELGGRPPVAHPLVPETLALCAGLPGRVLLTHFNHTNPLLDEGDPGRGAVQAAGVGLAYTGQTFQL